jgi:DtxR family transcriptional regulator, Mn-dependent transcriptional regulator
MSTVEQARTQAVEDYCKAIYTLESRTEEPVSTNALAERLEITPGSVSAMLKKLGELGLIAHIPYRGVRLTEDGKKVALEVIRHHRLLELFLAETLEMPWDRVHAEAEVLEHVISEELEQLIATKLGDPTLDPHGDPIPSAALELRERETVPLDSLKEGETGVFVRVSDADPEMLRYLSERGISPGERLEVRERQPFGGPLTVSFEGGEQRDSHEHEHEHEHEHALGGALARAMRVELDGVKPPAGQTSASGAPAATRATSGRETSPGSETPADRPADREGAPS